MPFDYIPDNFTEVDFSDFDPCETSEYAWDSLWEIVEKGFKERMKPQPTLSLVEWADKYRYLPDNSADSGRWKTCHTEVARTVMEAVTDKKVRQVSVMCCIQLMKTELMINTALYYIHQEPSPIMYVAPKIGIAEAWSKERFMKSVKATPVVREIFAAIPKDEGNTILQKQYPGGQISIVSARNPDDLAMRAVRIVLCDEVDKFLRNVGAKAGGEGGEGDPIDVVWGRATTFGSRAKLIVACSPTIDGDSRIQDEYLKSDQSVFYQTCPHCGHAKELKWSDVKIPRNDETGDWYPDKAYIQCSECEKHWSEKDRRDSIAKGYWVATRPHIIDHRGFKVSALAGPKTSAVYLAKLFVSAEGSRESLKTFYNCRMAETFKEVGDKPDWRKLYDNRQVYDIGKVPDGGLVITCGIDVQKDYLIYWLEAWNERRQSYAFDAGIIHGDISERETKEKLCSWLDTKYENSKGVFIPISMTCIDSGYKTQDVYDFVELYGNNKKLRAIKGRDGLNVMLAPPTAISVNRNGKKKKRAGKLWNISTDILKTQIYSWFRLQRPTEEEITQGATYPDGYCFIPQFNTETFKQLCGEVKVEMEDKRGYTVTEWRKVRNDNHMLDAKAYSRAGAEMLNLFDMTPLFWRNERIKAGFKQND